jgi:hypothetical protein
MTEFPMLVNVPERDIAPLIDVVDELTDFVEIHAPLIWVYLLMKVH